MGGDREGCDRRGTAGQRCTGRGQKGWKWHCFPTSAGDVDGSRPGIDRMARRPR
jgi:hypothetical protein